MGKKDVSKLMPLLELLLAAASTVRLDIDRPPKN
ncbi:Uncharacterised protein [Anaerotruncus sp. 2789STDY5834896]|uniref:Uncharacterized protein n=1 Tax=uncultured Anaerotruncus sp. TaxID=905011 RepID=A0A1C6GN11_9FIRM|nr:Uncharacterised protein [uncultured Anaerotruncus sp.]